MSSKRFVLGKLKVLAGLPRRMQRFFSTIVLSMASVFLALVPDMVEAACPDLAPYYPDDQARWPELAAQLSLMLEECLESPEYFALYGAAQLNSGNIAEASESLERALLLDPEHGAAQIDYAEALYQQGELFSALELNRQIMQREDLPANLQTAVAQRQQSWQSLTTERSAQIDLLAGYDNNLNSAPDSGQVTLTLSGEPVLLALNPQFRPARGPYLNFRMAGGYRRLAPQHQHNFVSELRGRASEDSGSDLLQFDSRYAFIKPGRNRSWQLNGGVSHLLFGGNSLYTATDASARYQPTSGLACKPYYGLAVQNQLFHDQRYLNAIESKASAGMNCPMARSNGRQQINAEIGRLNNFASKSRRPGGDRQGWQVNLDWRFSLPVGEIRSQLSHTHLQDSEGYTPLLDNGAKRWLNRSYVLLQYRRPLNPGMTLMINAYHQKQSSNLELFRSNDSTFEIGVSLAL